MTIFERLTKKIKQDLGLDVVNLQRTYAGCWMKKQGAFVWTGRIQGDYCEIGSCIPASDLIKKKYKLICDNSWSEYEIDIEEIANKSLESDA